MPSKKHNPNNCKWTDPERWEQIKKTNPKQIGDGLCDLERSFKAFTISMIKQTEMMKDYRW
ncbi:hypothetical protein KCU73_g12073, partial [Aureobasidium melanogenum]